MNPDDRSKAEERYAERLARREAGLPQPEDPAAADSPGQAAELQRLERRQERLEALLAAVAEPSGCRLQRDVRRSVSPLIGDADLAAGRIVAGFELVRPLGSGGMGLVWEARQTSLRRGVALKFIRPDLAHEGAVARFRTEALAGGRLNHPNIVSVIDSGVHAGRHWIAQELVEGGCTLRDVIEDFRGLERLPDDYYRRVAELFVQIAEALQTAHDAGVIHRDIKPQNILITREDRPKVGDFGLARLMDEQSATRLGLEGSLPYMSPEQAAAKSIGIDARSDVFSLGAVLYELLTLRRAFAGDSEVQILEHILHEDPPPPRRVRPGVPGDLSVIAMGALEKRRNDRYASMRALAEDLRRYLRDEPILRRPPAAWERARKWARRHPGRSASAALGLVLVGVLLVLVPELARRTRDAMRERVHALLVEARAAIERGDLEVAQAKALQAQGILPDDPRSHVCLATAFVQYARFRDAEEEIAAARSLGLSADPPPPGGDAAAHHAYAISRLVTDKSRGHAEAERHLIKALALDPNLEGALYPLYQIRKEAEDVEGARAALTEYRKRLTQGDAFFPVVEALLAELDGDFARALELLEPLEALPAQRRLDLRLPLVVGRNRLILGDLDGAEASLLEQVRGAPQNGAAWEYLAQIHLRRHDAARPPAPSAHLDAAEQAAARANDWDPHRARPFHLRIEIALRRLRARSDRYAPIPTELLANAERRLDELRELDGQDPLLAPYTSDLLFERALEALGRGDRAGARAFFEQCLATYPDSLVAAVLLAQELWLAGDFHASLARLEHALSIWEAGRWECHWLFTAHVWALGAADRLGDAERALRAHDAAEEWLAAGACAPDPAAVLTLAEFLAQSANADVRDCARALELIEEHDLERVFAGRDDALAALRDIRRACP